MADIPAAPKEGSSTASTDNVPMLSMTEDDGASGLRAVLLAAAYSVVTNAQRLGALCIGGAVAEDAAAAGFPVLTGGRYDATDRTLDATDVGANALDVRARQIVAPIVADSTTALASKVVANTTTEVLAAEANRVCATFVNDSDETMYLAVGVNAVMNQGIRINANGGSFEINFVNMDTREVDAICTSGGKILCVHETHRA